MHHAADQEGRRRELRDGAGVASVSSLRAYGLDEDLLDEMASVRASGLTFAPEAGTQRMRDVVNKNVTEEDIIETAERVFSRGWDGMKLYFMIGLPTEDDEDVRGIVETGGARCSRSAASYSARRAEVTVGVDARAQAAHAVSVVRAWTASAEIARKQALLRDAGARAAREAQDAREPGMSHIEGIFARGDRRLADVLEAAWRAGARFDGWDDALRIDLLGRAFAETRRVERRSAATSARSR